MSKLPYCNLFRCALTGLYSLLLVAGFAGPADSQTATPSKPWSYTCQQSKDKKQKLCSIVQNLAMTRGDKQKRLLTVIIQPKAKAKNHTMLLVLPHGLALPAGVDIKIDNNKPIKMVIQTSDARGAYAGSEISDELLAPMKKGIQMNVKFMSMDRKPITVPVSLNGFETSYSKLSAN